MKKHVSPGIAGWVIAMGCAAAIFLYGLGPDVTPAQQRNGVTRAGCAGEEGRLFGRTELFFGKGKPDGSMVTDQEFRAFLDEITPRFPNGLTALSATGQFRGSGRMITREGAMFVILLYPADDKESSARIEEIRDSYRRTFAQESVLRIDGESCVDF